MPSNDQLAAMLRSKVGAGSAEDLWALDGLEGEALVIGRQFAELRSTARPGGRSRW